MKKNSKKYYSVNRYFNLPQENHHYENDGKMLTPIN